MNRSTIDPAVKKQIKEFVGKPVAKDPDEATYDFASDSGESLDILVNVVSILPQEFNILTEAGDVDETAAAEMALHRPTCYFVMNNGSIENQDEFFERPDMA